MLAAVNASLKRRWGTVAQSLSAVSGSSEVAMSAVVTPPPTAEATSESLAPARHNQAMCVRWINMSVASLMYQSVTRINMGITVINQNTI